MSARKLQLVRDYVDAGLACKLTLEEIAASIHMSEYHFARRFKSAFQQFTTHQSGIGLSKAHPNYIKIERPA